MNETTVDESADEARAAGAPQPAQPPQPEAQRHPEDSDPPPAEPGPPQAEPEPPQAEAGAEDPEEEDPRTLPRLAWASTSGAFLVAVVILLARGDYGYAVVTFAVALAAAVNLL